MRALCMVGLWCVCAHAQISVAVLNAQRPAIFSSGEIGVMLDAITRELDKNGVFSALQESAIRSVFEPKNLERVDICPGGACLADMGNLLHVQTVVNLSVDQPSQAFSVKLTLLNVVNGGILTEVSGEFNGPKTGLVIKYIPALVEELSRKAAPLVKKIGKSGSSTPRPTVASAAAQTPATQKLKTEVNAAPAAPVAAAPQPYKKSLLRSPGFWIPVVVVLAGTAGVIYYLKSKANPSDDGNGGNNGVMPFPETPGRPPTSIMHDEFD
jgi:hypothetical protein